MKLNKLVTDLLIDLTQNGNGIVYIDNKRNYDLIVKRDRKESPMAKKAKSTKTKKKATKKTTKKK